MGELKKLYEELYNTLVRIYSLLEELTKRSDEEVRQEYDDAKEVMEKAINMYSLVMSKRLEIAKQKFLRNYYLPNVEDRIRYVIIRMEHLNTLLTKAFNACKSQEAYIRKNFNEKQDKAVYNIIYLPLVHDISPRLRVLMEVVENVIKSLKAHYGIFDN